MQGNILLLIPVLWPMLGALLGYLVGRRNKTARDYFADFVSVSEFAVTAALLAGVATGAVYTLSVPGICGWGLSFKLDGFRALYGAIAAFMWMMTTVFSREYLRHYRNRNRYYLFTLITCGATVGVFFSNDLFTTFIFFEVMSFTSYVMVVQDERPAALRAGETYVAVAVIGGMVMLMGLFLLYHQLGTLSMDELRSAAGALPDKTALYVPSLLILFGFGAKAGVFPLHIWLPKAHPVAPAPASALLSGILTKAGIFGILVLMSRVFFHDAAWGSLMLALAAVTMFLGAVLAVFSTDLKHTLACSSMSQMGFILVGVGMQGMLGEENALAVWGTTLHMVNHSLNKLVLFLCAGVIYMNCHQLDLNKLRGWGRNKPLLSACFLMGSLGNLGMPLLNGYISKTLLHESIVEYCEHIGAGAAAYPAMRALEWIFLISGGLTAAYMTKLYVAIFVEKPAAERQVEEKRYMDLQSALAVGIPALALPLLGMLPGVFMERMAALGQSFMGGISPEHAVHWFSLTNLKGSLISISIGAAVYVFIVRGLLMAKDETGRKVYVNRWPAAWDLENLIYRPLLERVLPFLGALCSRIADRLADWAMALLQLTVLKPFSIPARDPKDFEPGTLTPRPKESRATQRIAASLSFSLLLFGLGFCAALVYLLIILVLR